MGVLKRKEERTETMTLRVPASVKTEIDRLRERTNEAGFDLNGTICESIIRLTRQVRDEMDVEWGQLQLEQSTWATHSRIDPIAREQLGMAVPAPNTILINKQP